MTDVTIDEEQFADMQDLLEEDFADLVHGYLVDSERRIAELRMAQQNDDHAAGFDLAHTLKGASSNLGAARLSHLSYQMQEACRGQKLSEQSDLLDAIAAEFDKVKTEVLSRLS